MEGGGGGERDRSKDGGRVSRRGKRVGRGLKEFKAVRATGES